MSRLGLGIRWMTVVLACCLVAGLACRPTVSSDGDGDSDADGDGDGDVDCEPGSLICDGSTARTCNSDGDGYSHSEECTGDTAACASGIGCVYCIPGARQCDGGDVVQCNDAGSGFDFIESCADGTACVGGFCDDPCSLAEANNSYEGCEYRAVTLMNTQVEQDFSPALVISNRNDQAATVTVTRSGSSVAEVSVAPNSTETVELPWVAELKQEPETEEDVIESTNVPGGSYRVVSTLPVTVYQFNPLEYGLPRDCASESGLDIDGQCFSYSNDASLLLPVHVLTEHYIVMSRPNLGINYHIVDTYMGTEEDQYSFSPSTLAVVNPHDHEVTVELQFTAPTQAGPGLTAYGAGDSGSFTIAAGGVLQIAARIPESCTVDFQESEGVPLDDWGDQMLYYGYCDDEHDLTGTEVSASEPVAVFGGHNCDFIPFNRWACDHLEEQLFPFETWGKSFVLNQSHRENGEPDLFRVLSGADGNRVRFTPASIHSEVTLNRGQFIELEAHGAFEVESDEPILVGQFLVGQNYNDASGEDLPPGDPAFALAVPVEQYRSSYNFLAPNTYDRSYVNIITTSAGTSTLELDGASLASEPWETVGSSGYSALRHEVSPGSHSITAGTGVTFGILVYGYGQYTSYMFPCGLDLNQIAVW